MRLQSLQTCWRTSNCPEYQRNRGFKQLAYALGWFANGSRCSWTYNVVTLMSNLVIVEWDQSQPQSSFVDRSQFQSLTVSVCRELKDNYQRWISGFVHRWGTLVTAKRSVICTTQWVFERKWCTRTWRKHAILRVDYILEVGMSWHLSNVSP